MGEAKPQCPHCEAIGLRRHARIGFWQREVASRMGYFPWECGQCRKVFMLTLRSSGYREQPRGAKSLSLVERLLLKDNV